MRNWIAKLLSFFLKLSLFWKVGFIIGACVLVNFALTFYFYFLLEEIMNNPSLATQKELRLYFELSLLFLIIFIFIFLIWGALAFYYMVKRPLDRMRQKIAELITNPRASMVEMENISCLRARDEIGSLACLVENLIQQFKELEIYRHLIENDEDLMDIYTRLGKTLEKLSLGAIVIYEVSNSANTMSVVYKSDEDLEVNPEPLFNADHCRAKRTGEVVDSLSTPSPCKYYEYQGVTNHVCIPMTSGGKVLAVVEIHLPGTITTLKSKKIMEKLSMAKRYLEETAPVLESKRYALALKEQTLKDPLTGLYNRRFLEGILDNLTAQILRRGTTLGVLMCDLDYFKSINDKYGHDIGDLILKELANLLVSSVRKSDLVVRFGGEEFLILLIDMKEGESEKVAEKIRRKVEEHEFKTPKGIIRRTISIGCSEFPVDTTHIWEAIKFADVALYKAKELGRNKVVRFQREFWTSEEY
ncbi:MAG: diguanylate cyclase [Caldimicrobium sp.]|jgi:diguanylate cyclase (GGDEF)-like protein|nr:diguanylate cyclase [Caldimicrobium sp.]